MAAIQFVLAVGVQALMSSLILILGIATVGVRFLKSWKAVRGGGGCHIHLGPDDCFRFKKRTFPFHHVVNAVLFPLQSVFMHQRLCYFRNFIINVRTFNRKHQ